VWNHRGDLSRRGAYRRALKASASPCGGMGSPPFSKAISSQFKLGVQKSSIRHDWNHARLAQGTYVHPIRTAPQSDRLAVPDARNS